MDSTEKNQSIAAYDDAPFFERALTVAAAHNLIDEAFIAAIVNDAATGAIQIAEYFGESVHLRHNLEQSKNRMVSLISLYLEQTTHGDPLKAAQLLKDKSVRSLSRGGSQMLKALYALPEDDYFGARRLGSESEFLKASLSKGMSLAKYTQAVTTGEHCKQAMAFAGYLLKKTGAALPPFIELHASAQHVVRTSLLSLAYGAKKVSAQPAAFPDETALFEIFSAIRKEWSFLGDVTSSKKFVDTLPAEFSAYAKQILSSIETEDIPQIVSPAHTLEAVFAELKLSRYFFLYDPLSEMSRFDQALAEDWYALTGGSEDDSVLLTLFLSVAAGLPAKTMLTTASTKKAVQAIRAQGLMHKAVSALISKAPHDETEQLSALWQDFIEDAQPFLLDKSDEKFEQVLSYLKDHCNIQSAKKTSKA
jgi:hypothetical protein